jgi:trehalose/maltose hydrolase-like predicted phosphorylase
LRELVERACARGLHLAVVTGTHIGNVDRQLRARPLGPGSLHVLTNRGSEVYAVNEHGPALLRRRTATEAEEAALTDAVELTARRLAERGLPVEVVAARLNRRKLDLLPGTEWADPPKARLAELLAAVQERLRHAAMHDVQDAVSLAAEAAAEVGLSDARITSDAKHVEIGLTDKSDSARWIFGDLWRRGIPADLVLLAGDEFGMLGGLPGSDSYLLVDEASQAVAFSVGIEPAGVPERVVEVGGGPEAFALVLADQVRRRDAGEVPRTGADPTWTLTIDGFDPEREVVDEVLLTLADGRIGTKGIPVGRHPAVSPGVVAAGRYSGSGAKTMLLPCPIWNEVGPDLGDAVRLRRVLDLRSGLQRQELSGREGEVEAILFSSLARPGTGVLRAHGPASLLSASPSLSPPREPVNYEAGDADGRAWMRVDDSTEEVAAAVSEVRRLGSSVTLDRIATYAGGSGSAGNESLEQLRRAESCGFEALLVEQRETWGARWDRADIIIDGDPELQLAVRFALFHLMASVTASGEAPVGARGLSGSGYGGHVFWDADVYVLPFLAATHPPAARAMLEYRLRRMDAARANARAWRRAGARFPWESAAGGIDVTPGSFRNPSGELAPIRTGAREEHVTADVAWAACCYTAWSGDKPFATGPGAELLAETARYWATRVRTDSSGRGHIYGVIGPDEYHGPVDDDTYTNVMARWNLRQAAAIASDAGVPETERRAWLAVADSLVDGYNPATGLYQQFAGFFELEPLAAAGFATRSAAADGVAGTQEVKQADVLMLHHLVPDEVEQGSLERNLDFYEPRTAHGSSLSLGVHASLFARAGALERAVELLRLASRIDLDDTTGTTADGLHLAAMGSVWQALVFGFAGVRPRQGLLGLDPKLPADWRALEFRLRFRGSAVRVRIEHSLVTIHADPAIRIVLPSGQGADLSLSAGPNGLRLEPRAGGWAPQSSSSPSASA